MRCKFHQKNSQVSKSLDAVNSQSVALKQKSATLLSQCCTHIYQYFIHRSHLPYCACTSPRLFPYLFSTPPCASQPQSSHSRLYAAPSSPSLCSPPHRLDLRLCCKFGGPADQADPNQPSGSLVEGACGYGPQNRDVWPNWRVGAISPENPIAANASRSPKDGCGACLEIKCVPAPNVSKALV